MEEIIKMNRKALLIIDVQNDFVTGSLGSEYAKEVVVPNIVELSKQSDKKDIYFTLDIHYKDYLQTHEGKKLPIKHCIAGTKGSNIVDDLYEVFSGIRVLGHIFLKDRFGVLQSQYYEMLCYEDNIMYDEIHICGLVTDICVVSNALLLRSMFPEIDIIVHEDCCGGTSKVAHDAAISVMKSCQMEVV